MSGPHPAVAATRVALRRSLAQLESGALVFVAVSGGADSLALAAAAAFELPKRAIRVGAVIVDHRLQRESAQVAATAADRCRALGIDPVVVSAVDVDQDSATGPEAAARQARHRAFAEAVSTAGAACLLLGHTRDDQAETVLLRMARGSGLRALAAMSPDGPGIIRRPFLLDIARTDTRAACAAQGLKWWDDPHNEDARFTRVRTRRALAALTSDLGPGLVEGLARTAALARQDADHLDGQAAAVAARLGPAPWAVAQLQEIPIAIRARVWRILMARTGGGSADVAFVQVASLEALLTRWRGQGPVDIPGGLQVHRHDGVIETVARPVQ